MVPITGETRFVQTFVVNLYFKDPNDATDELEIQDALMYEDNPYRIDGADEVSISDTTSRAMYKSHGLA